ncbi:MAG: lipopolysaccharide kinase InaA family protein [Acidobacteriota bacterium]
MHSDVIHGYRLVTTFSTAGGGQCQWALAERDGVTYFLKRFLTPRFPVPGGPGSEDTRRRKRAQCVAFEQHHRALMEALQHRCGEGGNLVVTRAFFREGTAYYKVTDRIEMAHLSPDDIAALPHAQRLLLFKTITHSVAILHDANIVHGDLKPDNVLTKTTAAGALVTKLIDFDDSFFTMRPPAPGAVVGDSVYLAPEIAHYTSEPDEPVDPRTLTTKADIFSLGLLFATYTLGGAAFARFAEHGAQYAHEFILSGRPLPLAFDRIAAPFNMLVRHMLSANADARPSARDVLAVLKAKPGTTAAASRLRGTLVVDRPSSDTKASVPAPTLRGTLIRTTR